jgi:multiple sugar transport system permease protein
MSSITADAAAAPAERKVRVIPADRKGSAFKRAENRAAYIFLAPWLIGIVGITALPMLVSLYLSFTNYGALSAPSWVGIDNYIKLFTGDRRFIKSIWVTLTYVGWSVPLVLIFSLTIAVALNRGLAGLAIYRSLFYIPSLIGASVGIGLLWKQVFGERGVVNDILGLFGIAGKGWINNPTFALPSVIALHVWTFGASMVIFLAALRQIPESYYEAASIDGANGWQRFRRITLPLLAPGLATTFCLAFVLAFSVFPSAVLVGNPAGETRVLALAAYQAAYEKYDYSLASAIAMVMGAVELVVIGIVLLGRSRLYAGSTGGKG